MNILTKTNFPIVGTKFRGREALDLVKNLSHDIQLVLKDEFDNPYDNSAIAIYADRSGIDLDHDHLESDGLHIGYLPAVMNGEIASLIRGGEYTARDFAVRFDASEIGKARCNITLEAK